MFSTIPPEINYEIIRNQHPYYLVNGYCVASKFTLTECEKNKYELLQQWVHPDHSLLQLKNKYPDISLLEVVDLSLVYNPIIEVFEPDSLTLINNIPVDYRLILANAIKHRNMNVVDYILGKRRDYMDWIDFKEQNFVLLRELCFIYGYIEPLKLVSKLFRNDDSFESIIVDAYIDMIKIKLQIPFDPLEEMFYIIDTKVNILLWDLETYCEYIVIYTKLAGPNIEFDKLIGKVQPKSNYGDYRDLDNHMFLVASLLGKEKLSKIVNKYMKEVSQVKVYSKELLTSLYGNLNNLPSFLSKYTDYMSFGKLLFSPELAPQYITKRNAGEGIKVNLAAYYLLSGLYDWYVSAMLKNSSGIKQGVYLASKDAFNEFVSFDDIESVAYSYGKELI
jgi:hypothetical protein